MTKFNQNLSWEGIIEVFKNKPIRLLLIVYEDFWYTDKGVGSNF